MGLDLAWNPVGLRGKMGFRFGLESVGLRGEMGLD